MQGEQLRARIQAQLDRIGITAFEVERRAGLRRGYVHELLAGKKQSIREKVLPDLAPALECDVGFLDGTQDVPHLSDAEVGMRLSGIAEAGAWREADYPLPPDLIPILPDPRYLGTDLRIYLVRGDHAAGIGITNGSVVTVRVGADGLRDRDVVVANRERSDRSVETTIRVVGAGALSARPLSGSIPDIPLGEAEIVGRVVNAIRVFDLPQ